MITFPIFCNLHCFSLDLGLYQIFFFLYWTSALGATVTKSNKHINPKEKERTVQSKLLNQSNWQLVEWNGGVRAKRPTSQRTFLMMVPAHGTRCTSTVPRLPNMLIAVSNTNYRLQPLLRFQAVGLIYKSFVQPKFNSSCFFLCLLQKIRQQGKICLGIKNSFP